MFFRLGEYSKFWGLMSWWIMCKLCKKKSDCVRFSWKMGWMSISLKIIKKILFMSKAGQWFGKFHGKHDRILEANQIKPKRVRHVQPEPEDWKQFVNAELDDDGFNILGWTLIFELVHMHYLDEFKGNCIASQLIMHAINYAIRPRTQPFELFLKHLERIRKVKNLKFKEKVRKSNLYFEDPCV